MKTYQIPMVFLFLVSNMNTFSLSILEQLSKVNSHWNYYHGADKLLREKRVFTSEQELIQLHLQLVEKTLRANHSKGLNEEQKRFRLQLLDVLHDYWVTGVFPKNTGHACRTPYFIDTYGTACAVGQLIISSGYSATANQISRESNNGYIHELTLNYPQLKEWANKHGFDIEELAWIQPCYAPPAETQGLHQPTCHNAGNGYFCPDFSQMQGPLTKSFYRWADTGWVAWKTMCGHWLFDHLRAGKYKWEVKDSLDVTHTFSVELIAPPPATVTTLTSGSFNSCNGVITVSVEGGVSPFKYYWPGHTGTTSILTSVCEELVNLTFTEGGSLCPQFIKVQTGPVGLSENIAGGLRVSPNPVSDILQLRLDSKPGHSVVRLLNIHGQSVLQEDLRSELTNIDLSQLPRGLYFLLVNNQKVQRIIKE